MKSGSKHFNKRRHYPVLLKRERNRSGAVLLFIVVTMIIMAVLGAAMVSIYSSSTVSQATPNQLRRAYYMAESGLRWVMGEVRAVSTGRRTKLISMNGASRNVSTEEGFSIKVYPYWLSFSGGTGSSSFTHTATVEGSGLPENLSFPSGTIISIGGVGNFDVSSANISSNRKSVTFSFVQSFSLVSGHTYDGFVSIKTTGSAQTISNGPGSSMTMALTNTYAIPENNGSFTYNGTRYYYRKARVTGSNVTLSDLTWSSGSTAYFPGDVLVSMTWNAQFESTGSYQSNNATLTNTDDYMTFEDGPSQNNNILVTGFSNNDLSAFESTDLQGDVYIQQYIATGGTHPYWAAFQDIRNDYRFPDPQNPGFYIAMKTVRLDEGITDQLKHSWQTYGHLTYDYQVKCGWGLDLDTAGQGINVRWHESSPGSGLYEGYALSYIAYEGITEEACGWVRVCFLWWCWDEWRCEDRYIDYIPNSIKPVDEQRHLWLILWKQYVEGGVEKRKWLAYAELGDHGGSRNYSGEGGGEARSAMQAPKIVGNQGWPDGILNDNASMNIRVYDKWVYDATIPGMKRVTDIKSFAGEASTRTGYGRITTGESNATDYRRKRYIPEWAAGGPAMFPTWPSNLFLTIGGGGVNDKVIRYWDNYYAPSYDLDYFTLASNVPIDTSKIRWIKRSGGTTGMELVDDKTTIRLSGSNQYVLDSWEGDRREMAVHAMGEVTTGNRTVAFDDMASQILGGIY